MKDLTRYNEKEKIEKEQLCPVENVVTRLPEPSLVRKEVCICRILIRRVSVSSPPVCPLLSSLQSGYCLSHSLTPQCHQLAKA